MKLTFKRHSPTGKYRSFELTYTDIKLKGKCVGGIFEQRDTAWKIKVIIKDKAKPCGWRWVGFIKCYACEQDARDFVLSPEFHRALASKNFELHQLD